MRGNSKPMPLADRRRRHREIINYVAQFPEVTATEVAMAFEVSEALVRWVMKRAGFRLIWKKI